MTKRLPPRGSEPFEVTRRDSMREWLEDGLRPLAELELRAMFGGFGIYSEGTMFGILHTGRVYLKTDDATRPAFTERGSEPFRPTRGSTLTSYVELPPEVLDDEEELVAWSRKALAIARATPAKSRARPGVRPEQILEAYPSSIKTLAEQLRRLVLTTAPDATEAGYPGWRLIGYRSPHYFCFIAPHPDHVRLGFEHGHRVSDPHGVLESMGKQVKFVRLVPGQRLPVTPLRELIEAALVTRPLGTRSRAKR
jgi:DNA transformation protein